MGRARSVEAIVVGSVDVGESDRVVRLLTPDAGRTAVMARRARASKKRFAGLLEPGTRLHATVARGRGKLEVLDRADRVSGPDVARTDLDRIALVAYGCELCAGLAPEGSAAPKLFRLLEVWLGLLEGDAGPTVASRVALEAKALTFAGITPALVRCSVCGDDLDDPAMFDAESGGALHGRCGGGAPVSAADLLEIEALRRTPLADTVQHHAQLGSRWILADFVQHHLGRRLNSRAMLESLSG